MNIYVYVILHRYLFLQKPISSVDLLNSSIWWLHGLKNIFYKIMWIFSQFNFQFDFYIDYTS